MPVPYQFSGRPRARRAHNTRMQAEGLQRSATWNLKLWELQRSDTAPRRKTFPSNEQLNAMAEISICDMFPPVSGFPSLPSPHHHTPHGHCHWELFPFSLSPNERTIDCYYDGASERAARNTKSKVYIEKTKVVSSVVLLVTCCQVLLNVARCDQGIDRCDQVLPGVTSCLPVVTSSCFLYCKIPKHVFGHISCLEAGPLTKTGQNDRNVEPVHHVKFGGHTWPYKIVTASNVQNLPEAVASIPL